MGLFSKRMTRTLAVGGMHCQKCVARVTAALEGVDGVTDVSVTLNPGKACVAGHGFAEAALVAAVEALGFSAAVVAEGEGEAAAPAAASTQP